MVRTSDSQSRVSGFESTVSNLRAVIAARRYVYQMSRDGVVMNNSGNIFSDEFGRILSDRNRTLKENDFVFVQTGAHDLSTRGLAVTMSTGICRFVESLAELEDVSQRKGFNVVVLTSPPSRDTDNRLKTRVDGITSYWLHSMR